MKSIGVTKRIMGVFIISSLMGGLSALAKPIEKESENDVPKIISETRYFKDVSAYFNAQLPFLKKGFRFVDSSLSLSAEEGAVSSLIIEPPISSMPGNAPTPEGTDIRTTKDFSTFVEEIKTEKEAYDYVLFLSRKGFPWMETIRFDYFEDIPFIGLEFVHASTTTLAQSGVRAPSTSVKGGRLFGKKTFTVVRTVVPLDQPNLAEKNILAGKTPLQIAELAEVTETVGENGSYSFTLRRFPVKNFFVENPLIALRKPTK